MSLGLGSYGFGFLAGGLSILSPCVLPLVPGYVSMVSGLSAAELTARRAAGPVGTTAAPVSVRPMLRGIARLRFKFVLTMAAYDLIRLPKLLGASA